MNPITIEPTFMKLIEAHARVALIKIRKPTNYELNDLINEGIVLFIKTKEKLYLPTKGCSLKTFFTRLLRNFFRDIVKISYRTSNYFNNNTQKNKYIEHLQNTHKEKNPLKLASTNIMLSNLSSDEKKYAEKMLLSLSTSVSKRRNETRENLQLSIEQENEIRKNIFIKLQK